MKPEEDIYRAERLLDERICGGKRQYLVKWKGWSIRDSTWEPVENLLDKRLIYEFERNHTTPLSNVLTAKRTRKSAPAAVANRNSQPSRSPATTPKHDEQHSEENTSPSTSSKVPKPETPGRTISPHLSPVRKKTTRGANMPQESLTNRISPINIRYLQMKLRHERETYEAELAIVKLQEKKLQRQIENVKELENELRKAEKSN